MYTGYVSGIALEISMIKLSRRGPCMVVPSDYAIAMDEYFWSQWQGYGLAE